MDDRIREAAALFSGRVAEIRALTHRGVRSGYFDDRQELVRQVTALDTDPEVQGIYITLNEVNPALLARRANRILLIRGKEPTTGDTDIVARRWLPIDIDPVRPSGVSSSEEEHEGALAKAREIAAWLAQRGFPEPVLADSGNGAHLLYRVDLPGEDGGLVHDALAALDAVFSGGQVAVDTANHNAARIWRLYGTMSRKGDSTPDRPHRRSRIISVPSSQEIVSPDLLRELAGSLPTEEKGERPPSRRGGFDLRSWLEKHGIGIRSEKPYRGGTLYVLGECPFSSAHKDGAFAIRFANGAIYAGCHHNSCGGGKQRWQELRDRFGYERLLSGPRKGKARSRANEEGYTGSAQEQAGFPGKSGRGIAGEKAVLPTETGWESGGSASERVVVPQGSPTGTARETMAVPEGNSLQPVQEPEDLPADSGVETPGEYPPAAQEPEGFLKGTQNTKTRTAHLQDAGETGEVPVNPQGAPRFTSGTRGETGRNGSPDPAINSRQVYGNGGDPEREVPGDDGESLPPFPLTDAGNAERLVARFGGEIRYCAGFAAWFVWNGKVWERDEPGKMLLLATETARAIHAEASRAGTIEEARALGRWAVASESLHARKAMIDSAAPLVPIAPKEFDAGPDLLNVRNGTIDLATREFREFRKEDMLTRMAAVDYDPSADCPQWKSHLDLIFAGDPETIRGFQAMCGYSLLAVNPEQLMFILYGKGRNGKSKTIEVLARILGNYAVNIASESLTVHRFETARSDLARLAGTRMATAGEGEDGARLAESVIKQLTGEYAITVRRLYENEFEFTPNAKIWLSTNHEPVIRGTDDGIWRRIWMVPFTVQIPEEKRDPEIAAKLLAESPGILNWCLEGLRIYRENGNRLFQPAKVARATSAFRTVSDTIGLFLSTECTFESGARMSRGALKEMLEKWCEEEGIRQRISGRKLADALKERGVKDGGNSCGTRYWDGIRLKFNDERELREKQGYIQDVLQV